ncbi:GNAT family N-acetyltransferase [Pseudomonas sp. USHLN015]|uniref:GNAT family N-acetyltransferase n=1 Tax=Pseudomonas sp. USHLN015 TaxID=3081296 RepID=UPI00301DE442
MYRLDWLRNHPQHSDTYALWLYRQFAYEFADQPLEDWQREFAEGQLSGEWQCLVALDGERLLGGAALAADDLPGRDDLGPWLACVFTTPEARGQGIAERLIEGICEQARSQGHVRLYLHTQDRADYYARRGWTPLESFHAWGAEHTLMWRALEGAA